MIWGSRRYCLTLDMNPLVVIHSSSEVYPKGLFIWLFIQGPYEGFMPIIRG